MVKIKVGLSWADFDGIGKDKVRKNEQKNIKDQIGIKCHKVMTSWDWTMILPTIYFIDGDPPVLTKIFWEGLED